MKHYLLLLPLTAIFLSFQQSTAQNTSPYWSLSGNSNTTTSSKLGTTNAMALKFYTNNVQRMVIGRNTGNVGIGTNDPNGGRLHISSPLGVNALMAQVGGNTKLLVHSGGGVSVGASVVPPANGLYVAGSSRFNNQLTVAQGGLRVDLRDEADTGLVVRASGFNANQIGIIAGGYGTGLVAGGFYYGIRAAGNVGMSVSSIETGMEMTGYGDGINITVAGSSGLRSRAGEIGVYGEAAGVGVLGYTEGAPGAGVYGNSKYGYGGQFNSTNDYGLVAQTTNGDYAGVFYGSVFTSGTYVSSDKNLKQNVQGFEDAMDLISKLKPRYYEYKREGQYTMLNLPKGQHYGLLAQDVEEVLPNLVTTSNHQLIKPLPQPDSSGKLHLDKTTFQKKGESLSLKAVNYTELIPIIIKGMQEQEEEKEHLKAEVDALKEKVEELSKMLVELKNGSTGAISSVSGSLEQNTPNPVSGTTTIRYHIPESAVSAKLVFTNAKGQQIKTMSLGSKGTGQINLNTSMLAAGTYNYTLYVDGRPADTKRLVIAR